MSERHKDNVIADLHEQLASLRATLADRDRTIAEMGEALKAADELADTVWASLGLVNRGMGTTEHERLILRVELYRQHRRKAPPGAVDNDVLGERGDG